jgi:hypothetical protein
MHVVSSDAVEYLVAFDTTAYFSLRSTCQDIFKLYAITLGTPKHACHALLTAWVPQMESQRTSLKSKTLVATVTTR